MTHLLRLWPMALLLMFVSTEAEARKPANVFKGTIIMSTQPFPARFSSDRRFIAHMKKVDTKTFTYADGDDATINIEFMAFFRSAKGGTEFPVMVYDVSEGRTQVTSFPIYPQPGQKSTRILASYFRLEKSTFPDMNRKYEMVVTSGGRVVAKTKFTIGESAAARAKRKAEEEAIRKGSVVSF